MEEILIEFSKSSEPKQKLRGAMLFSSNNHGGPVYVLEEGYSKIVTIAPDQRETIFRCDGPGSILGYSVLDGRSQIRSSAQMITSGVVREIPAAKFDHLLRSDFRIWRWLAQQEAKQRESLEKRLEIMGLADAKQRIRALLPHLIRECSFPLQPNGSFIIPLKQSELASFAGVTRETTSATLNALCRQKLIEILRGRIVIPDLAALENAGPIETSSIQSSRHDADLLSQAASSF